jgi:hypothetical protein
MSEATRLRNSQGQLHSPDLDPSRADRLPSPQAPGHHSVAPSVSNNAVSTALAVPRQRQSAAFRFTDCIHDVRSIAKAS